jgi:hypothetical protein
MPELAVLVDAVFLRGPRPVRLDLRSAGVELGPGWVVLKGKLVACARDITADAWVPTCPPRESGAGIRFMLLTCFPAMCRLRPGSCRTQPALD